MNKKFLKAVAASFMAASMLTTTVATVVPMTASAGEILGESTFDYKALPWHTCETTPAKQTFSIEDGAFHITVTTPLGGEKSKWDLQFRHRNIDFKAGHKYEVSFDVKAKRAGMQLCSKIGNIKGDEEYFELDGNKGNMHNGPHMNGEWGSAATLTTSWQTFSGTFTPTKDLEAVEWCFQYAEDHNGYGGNAQEGDELWFDNMHIVDTTEDAEVVINSYGQTSRDWSPELGSKLTGGKTVNFISVNQVGYYSNLSKIATLGDNAGDILHESSKIDIGTSALDYEIKDATSGSVVYEGKTIPKGKDGDSGDNCHLIDFTEFATPGRYYIQIKGKEWRSYEFNIGDNIYSDDSHDMLTNAMNYFYQNRSGIDIESAYITSGDKTTLAHEGGHKTDVAHVQKEWVHIYSSADEATGTYSSSQITATGGWYDAGDHGKYVVNGGISVWTLQNMYERAVVQGNGDKFADGSGTVVVPETGNKVPDVLDECAVELDWMMDMVVKSDEPTWGKYAGLVYHKLHDHKWTGLATRPYDYEEEWGTERIVKPPTYAATYNFIACAAQAARLWEPYDSQKAAKYLEAAKKSYEAVEAVVKPYSNSDPLYAPLDQAIGGGAYGDNEVEDDAYWAACELYATTGDSKYYNDLSGFKDSFKVLSHLVGGENKGSFGSFNWGNTSSAGTLSLYLNQDLAGLTDANKTAITDSLTAAADLYVAKEAEQGYGIPYEGTQYTDPVNLPADLVITGYEWGSNSFVVNNAIIMAYAYDETDDIKYMNGVSTAMDYIFGRNPMAYSYVSGYGTYTLKRPHHRYWSNELDSTLPMAPDGVLSGGANAGLQDPYVRALGFVPGAADNASQRCYVDSIEAWSTNEVTINWNSPFAWVVSFMQDEAAGANGVIDTIKPTNPTTSPSETDPTETTGNETTEPSNEVTKPSYSGNTDGLLYGDVDVNGAIELADLTALSKYLLNNTIFPLKGVSGNDAELAVEQSDTKYDSLLNSADASLLAEYILEKIDESAMGPKN